jgi:hypothetical protein
MDALSDGYNFRHGLELLCAGYLDL